jgi:hypothetical protein
MMHHCFMRTTVSLDDDVAHLVRQYAESRSLRFGKALSELCRRAFSLSRPTRLMNGLLVFDLPAGSAKVTTRKVRQIEAESK